MTVQLGRPLGNLIYEEASLKPSPLADFFFFAHQKSEIHFIAFPPHVFMLHLSAKAFTMILNINSVWVNPKTQQQP